MLLVHKLVLTVSKCPLYAYATLPAEELCGEIVVLSETCNKF